MAIKIYKALDNSGNPIAPIDPYVDGDVLPMNYVNLYGEAGVVEREDMAGIARIAKPILVYLSNDDPAMEYEDITIWYADFDTSRSLPSPLVEFHVTYVYGRTGYSNNTDTSLITRNATIAEYNLDPYIANMAALPSGYARNEYTTPSGTYSRFENVGHVGYYTVTGGVSTYVPLRMAYGDTVGVIIRANLPFDFSTMVKVSGALCVGSSEVV